MEILEPVGIRIIHTNRRERNHGYTKSSDYDRRNISTVIFVEDGEVFLSVNGRLIAVKKNEIASFDTNSTVEKLPVTGAGATYVLLSLQIIAEDRLPFTISNYGIPVKLVPAHPDEFKIVMNSIHAEFSSKKEFGITECAILGLKLVNMLRKESSNGINIHYAEGVRLHKRIRETLLYIRENYKKRILLGNLAKMACMHVSRFSHLFREQVGVSPIQYVLDFKISKACDYMLVHGLSASRVAVELSFHDHAHFCRAFKKVTGKTPRQFIAERGDFFDPQ